MPKQPIHTLLPRLPLNSDIQHNSHCAETAIDTLFICLVVGFCCCCCGLRLISNLTERLLLPLNMSFKPQPSPLPIPPPDAAFRARSAFC